MAWKDLTDKEKQLDRAIDRCGVQLNSSESCLRKVMRAIGATADDTNYVRERIELRLKANALLDKTDQFITDTENMLKFFEKDDEEWKSKGRTLGFDF